VAKYEKEEYHFIKNIMKKNMRKIET